MIRLPKEDKEFRNAHSAEMEQLNALRKEKNAEGYNQLVDKLNEEFFNLHGRTLLVKYEDLPTWMK